MFQQFDAIEQQVCALIAAQNPQIGDDKGRRGEFPALHARRVVEPDGRYPYLLRRSAGLHSCGGTPQLLTSSAVPALELVMILSAKPLIIRSMLLNMPASPGCCAEKTVIDAFAGQAALVIKNQRHAGQFFEKITDEGTFVQVCMDKVRTEIRNEHGGLEEQQQIQVELVQGRAGFKPGIPGYARDTDGRDARHVPSEVIGDDADIVPLTAERPCFFIYPYVAAPVGKIGGGRQHENLQLSYQPRLILSLTT